MSLTPAAIAARELRYIRRRNRRVRWMDKSLIITLAAATAAIWLKELWR